MMILICHISVNYIIRVYDEKELINNNINIGIIDTDETNLSNILISDIKEGLRVQKYNEQEKGIKMMSQGKIDCLLVIHDGYEELVRAGELSKLFTVYNGYSPNKTELVLEIVSSSVLKRWIRFKIDLLNENNGINIDWKQLNDINISNLVKVEEIFINDKDNIDISSKAKIDKKLKEKGTIYLIIWGLGVLITLSVFKINEIKDKESGIYQRIITFHNMGENYYIINRVVNVLGISIVTWFYIIVFKKSMYIRNQIMVSMILYVIIMQLIIDLVSLKIQKKATFIASCVMIIAWVIISYLISIIVNNKFMEIISPLSWLNSNSIIIELMIVIGISVITLKNIISKKLMNKWL
ncbi:ABC transporter permease [Oceanirhabdus sp. W0125-5]|uniref:ABC transporter permease n=1 Tax=Oceanirhabdus sp. W0125-5 TaxID=2999116 RepID=UPI0022F306A9|nr:ABC transporter permease [Oceanirhabdus sp. W0125-5]WBW97826.1 ABC transporter permease [Oceanirhabdus sp. W0125-5]